MSELLRRALHGEDVPITIEWKDPEPRPRLPFGDFHIEGAPELQAYIAMIRRVQNRLWLDAGLQDPALAAMHRVYRRRSKARRRRR
jgi:hypothetical protein